MKWIVLPDYILVKKGNKKGKKKGKNKKKKYKCFLHFCKCVGSNSHTS